MLPQRASGAIACGRMALRREAYAPTAPVGRCLSAEGWRSVAGVVDAHRTALLGRVRSSGWVPDVLAAVLAVGVLVAVSAHIPAKSGRPLDALGYVLLVAAGVSMGLCRRWPRTVAVIVTVVLGVFIARRYPDGPVWATAWIALAALSWRTSRQVALAGAALLVAALSIVAVLAGRDGLVLPVIFVGWAAAAVLGSDALRSRRSYLAGLKERALYLERTREEEARRRVAEERLRIARDLHDSVAHAMATINVQAGAAKHVLDRRPEAAGEALAVIQRASGDVLDELGAMLRVLRDDTQQADRAPVPGAGDITRLAESTAASGLTVELSLEGPVEAMPGVIGTAAYRLVQESLTNVLRHSQAGTAQVQLVSGPDGSVLLEVADDGPSLPQAAAGTGVGIRGMRERVVSTGGSFQAGPASDGGFLVRAEWGARP
jgi:signal transduction histidine kinase